MTPQQQQAQSLFFSGTLTRKEIAAKIGITERTLFSWIHAFSWQRLCDAAITAPAVIADKICSQIVELQNHISSRESGKRFPDILEVEIIRKLVGCLDKLKKYPSKSVSMQAVSSFANFILYEDEPLAEQVMEKYKEYITCKPADGFEPYSVEYDSDFVATAHVPPGTKPGQPIIPDEKPREVSGNNIKTGNETPIPSPSVPVIVSLSNDKPVIAPSPSVIVSLSNNEPVIAPPVIVSLSNNEPVIAPPVIVSLPNDELVIAPPVIESLPNKEPAVAPSPSVIVSLPNNELVIAPPVIVSLPNDISLPNDGNSPYIHIIPLNVPPSSNENTPVALEDFGEYGDIVWNWTPLFSRYTYYLGNRVSTKWLQYNFFQWCLQPHERRFIHSDYDYQQLIDHNDTCAAINRYITACGKRPPSRAA